MKNCFQFNTIKLTNFIVTFGVFAVLDVLDQFGIFTDVVTLGKDYLRNRELEKMRFGAILTEEGYLKLKAQSDLIKRIINIICNPGSPQEAVGINSALKCLCMKFHSNTNMFYELMSEALHQRTMFHKLSQIYGPLIEEVKINQQFLIMLINNRLISMEYLQELTATGDEQQYMRIAHYIIHNINNYRRLKRFHFICQQWVRDTNLIEQIEDISFELEMIQYHRIEEKIKQDQKKTLCEIY